MNCPNCSFYVQPNANFCQNCGYRFDAIPQVERIEIVVPPEQPELPTFVVPKTPPVVVTQTTKSGGKLPIIVLTVMTTLIVLGGLGLLGYILFFRSPARETAAANNNNNNSANTAPKPSPTTYEDWKNKTAPEDKRSMLVDEQITIGANTDRRIKFTIPTGKTPARIVGGLKVLRGDAVNLRIYPPDSDDLIYNLEAVRDKIINTRLEPGEYVLIFEPAGSNTTVAAELYLVFD